MLLVKGNELRVMNKVLLNNGNKLWLNKMKWIIHPNLAKTLLSGHHRKKIKKQPKHGVTSRSGRDSSSPQNVLVCSCGTFRMKYLMPSVKVYFIQQDGGGQIPLYSFPAMPFILKKDVIN